jgi:hypothetical protein
VDQEDNSRNNEIVKLSEAGMTHTAIAERFGITRQRVGAILSRQAQQQEESERTRQLRGKYDELEKLTRRPPIKTTSIGRTQYDPRTCTCQVRGRTDIPHAEDCKVQPVLDEHLTVSAAREQRLILAQLAKEEKEQVASEEEQQQMMSDILGAFQEAYAEVDQLKIQVRDLKSRLAAYESETGEIILPAQVVI